MIAHKVRHNRREDIVLDTGCARTMVRRDLVPQKTEVGRVCIRCAHGDTREYPLSSVEIGIGEAKFQVEAAVSSSLPEPVLLGRDVPGLIDMLQSDQEDLTLQTEEALAVVTRSQARRLEEDRLEQERKQQEVGAKLNPMKIETATDTSDQEIVTDTLVNQEMEKPVGAEMDPDLFINVKECPRLSRREKRQQRHQMAQVNQTHTLDLSTCELRKMQQEDATLEDIRAKVRNPTKMTRRVFYEENGLLYRQWTPPQGDEDTTIQQLVLPEPCCSVVMSLAHHIPMAGHMGQWKTVGRILQRFYWLTVFEDVKQLCQTCSECQKTAVGKKQGAPMVPLPIIREPFERIVMDIVGPLPHSRAGNRYILVICDYSTRYPEAIPLRAIDAEHVAKELMVFFTRVGIPREILTDQGANFTSGLLAELYRLLKDPTLIC